MTRAFQPLVPATPTFTETGLACSDRYDDLYHAASGALEQAEYVFLGGNGLPERWRGREQFTIVETGFGLGNNFLATWAAWRQDEQRSRRLHFVSFEAHPFYAKDLALMLTHTPAALRKLADQLLAQWPVLVPGIHRLEFEQGAVTLTLFFGDIRQAAKQMVCQADAFYLDGFAPRVNPAMWTPEVFGQLVRMAAPGATAATWCAAAQVRRDLQNAGFVVTRHPGFAYKRHMIKATLRPHLGRSYTEPPQQPVIIVGGGIAGAATAHALSLRGIATCVLDPHFMHGAGGAQLGHAGLAMTPLLTRDDAPRARLSRAGILRALQRWQSSTGAMQVVGSLVVAQSEEEAFLQQQSVAELAFDLDWVQYLTAQDASRYASTPVKHGALYFPKGAVIRPQELLTQLLETNLVTWRADTVVTVHASTQGWKVITRAGDHYEAQHVILANAQGITSLLPQALHGQAPRVMGLDVIGGQSISIAHAALNAAPSCIVAGSGYVVPLAEGYVLGSTYDQPPRPLTQAACREIFQKTEPLVPLEQDVLAVESAWVGTRAALKDHLPVLAQPLPGLWLNAGYGSYGFSWAAVLAEQIAAQMAAEPALIERDLSRALDLR